MANTFLYTSDDAVVLNVKIIERTTDYMIVEYEDIQIHLTKRNGIYSTLIGQYEFFTTGKWCHPHDSYPKH